MLTIKSKISNLIIINPSITESKIGIGILRVNNPMPKVVFITKKKTKKIILLHFN